MLLDEKFEREGNTIFDLEYHKYTFVFRI